MKKITEKGNGNIVSLMAVGDVMLGREVGRRIEEEGAEWVFSEVKHLLEKADLVIGNLECPIIDDQNLPCSRAKVPLRASRESIKALQLGNFSIVTIGNNHILDFGEEGLSNTLKILNSNQIYYVGAGRNISEARRPLKLGIKGLRLGFLSYSSSYNANKATPGTAPLDPRSIKKDISELKKDSDIIIVSLHHGVEYADYPTPGFIKLARELIDSGARVVLGHHPHVLQGIEEYKNGIIAYSLGNFVFDLPDEKLRKSAYERCVLTQKYGVPFEANDTRVSESMILEIELGRDGLLSYKVHPIFIKPDFRPVRLDGVESNKLLQKIEYLSKNIGNRSLAINQVLKKLEADSLQDYLRDKSLSFYLRRLGKLKPSHVMMIPCLIRSKLGIRR